jgi:hypothetical protein
VDIASKLLTKVSGHATDILTAAGVATVFGQPSAGTGWPFAVNTATSINDANIHGAKLVDAIGTQLTVPPDYKLKSGKFQQLQTVATQGALTLQLVLTTEPFQSPLADLVALISQAYTWLQALQNYQKPSP